MEKLDLTTPDFTEENIAKIAALFPNVVTEAKGADGKVTQAIDFDVLRQELSANIVEGPQERYQLNWPGKRQAMLAANAPINKTLRPVRDESVNFDSTRNLFIEGDNLDALKLLQETYLGKVKLIYIDPPYNTGQDFIYKDRFKVTKKLYEEKSGQRDEEGGRLVANPESNGRFHSDWLSMIYPRLKTARNLLSDDGLIFISIDNSQLNDLQKICYEIFGEDNFIELFTWHTKNSAKGVPPKNMVVNIHEYVVCYSKHQDAKLLGELRTEETFANPDNDPRGLWRMSNIKSTIERPKDRFTISDPVTGNSFTNYWAFSEVTLQEMIEERRIIFPKANDGLPKQKEFLEEFSNPNMPIKSHFGLFHSQDKKEKQVDEMMGTKVFLYRKPVELIKKIVQQGGNDRNYIVLDFFAGSATTAQAVLELNAEDGCNRNFIMIQIPEICDDETEAVKAGLRTIAEIGKERIRRAGARILDDNPDQLGKLDVGFRVLKIDSGNMADVFHPPEQVRQEDLLRV